MKFTYDAYREMLCELKKHGYRFCKYNESDFPGKKVILRHDIDTSIPKALEMAKIEAEEGVVGTYFVLVSTDMYNLNSKSNIEQLKEIRQFGGEIGLHFDEVKYDIKDSSDLIKHAQIEKMILECAIGEEVKTISMHRPSKWVLGADVVFPDMINSYGKKFFEEFKYVSDSRMMWRENVEEIIKTEMYEQLHILTHAFWYNEKEETSKEILRKFVEEAKINRYNSLAENIRDLAEILTFEEMKG